MILGYGIIAVPTGIVIAETVETAVGRKISTRSCPECTGEDHRIDARYGRDCGAPMGRIQAEDVEAEETRDSTAPSTHPADRASRHCVALALCVLAPGAHAVREDGPRDTLGRDLGDLEALRDVDLEIDEGGVVAILGDAGAGKSTLIRALHRLQEHVEGEIADCRHDVEGTHHHLDAGTGDREGIEEILLGTGGPTCFQRLMGAFRAIRVGVNRELGDLSKLAPEARDDLRTELIPLENRALEQHAELNRIRSLSSGARQELVARERDDDPRGDDLDAGTDRTFREKPDDGDDDDEDREESGEARDEEHDEGPKAEDDAREGSQGPAT